MYWAGTRVTGLPEGRPFIIQRIWMRTLRKTSMMPGSGNLLSQVPTVT